MALVLCAYILYFGIYSHSRTKVWYNVDTLKKEIWDILQQRDDYQPSAQLKKNKLKKYNYTDYHLKREYETKQVNP